MKQAQGTDRELLEQAVTAYRRCLELAAADRSLAADARANLDLALRFRMESSRPADPPGKEKGSSESDPKKKESTPENKKEGKSGQENSKGSPTKKGETGKGPDRKGGPKDGPGGILQVRDDALPDAPLLPSQAGEMLERALRRIQDERLRHRRDRMLASPDVPNW